MTTVLFSLGYASIWQSPINANFALEWSSVALPEACRMSWFHAIPLPCLSVLLELLALDSLLMVADNAYAFAECDLLISIESAHMNIFEIQLGAPHHCQSPRTLLTNTQYIYLLTNILKSASESVSSHLPVIITYTCRWAAKSLSTWYPNHNDW